MIRRERIQQGVVRSGTHQLARDGREIGVAAAATSPDRHGAAKNGTGRRVASADGGRATPRLARLFRIDMTTPDMVFSPRLRRAGMIWVVLTLPLVPALGVFVHGEHAYLVSWVLASGLYTTPALVITFLAIHGAPRDDKRFWQLWFVGQALVYAIGVSVLLMVVTGLAWIQQGGGVAVVVATVVFGVALVRMMRSRSGGRALSLDIVDQAILVVGIIALVPLLAEPIISSPAAWFAMPAALVMVALIVSFSWSLTLFVRLDHQKCTVETLGIALAFIASVDAAAQVAQGLSNFTLPSSPLLLLQGLCMALVLLTPLYLPRQAPAGLDRLPPHAQVRGGGVAPLPAAIPLLALATVAVRDQVTGAVAVFTAVLVLLLVLSTVRHLLTLRETKRLYHRVERAAEERRLLLADVMLSADQDRHRVAAQLHEQATSSYVAFVSYLRAAGDLADISSADSPLATIRDDLARQAESLRRLMLAVKPLEVATPGPQRLAAPIGAYVDSLYGDAGPPPVDVTIDEDLALDWTTETIVFRIVQEALRNVWGHADAHSIQVYIGCCYGVLEVRVKDDGVGFDPSATLFESGIASMRAFAAFTDGSVQITSAPGSGTAVVARLGADPSDSTRSPRDPAIEDEGATQTTIDTIQGARPPSVVDLRLIEGGVGTGLVSGRGSRDVLRT